MATVDRVLNGRHSVRAATAERVLAAAEAGDHALLSAAADIEADEVAVGADQVLGRGCNELTAEARAGLIDGVLTAVISTPTALLAERAVAAMSAAIAAPQETAPSPVFVPFELYLPTNV